MFELLEGLESWSKRWRALFVVGAVSSLAVYAAGPVIVEYVAIFRVDPYYLAFFYVLMPIILTAPKYIALGLVSLPLYRNETAVARAFLTTLTLAVALDAAVIVVHFLGMDYWLGDAYWPYYLVFALLAVIVFWVAYIVFMGMIKNKK